MSVVFDFNDSHNDVAPVSSILFPVDLKKGKRVNCLWMSFVCILLSSRPRLSVVSVVFDFSASLSDVTPVSLTLLPFDVMRKEKSELLMNVFLCVFFLLSSLQRSS